MRIETRISNKSTKEKRPYLPEEHADFPRSGDVLVNHYFYRVFFVDRIQIASWSF